MKLIVMKGVAGLGNRMTALGNAFDLALHHDCPLHVDWHDPEWRRPFSDMFQLHSDLWLRDMPSDTEGEVFPKAWKGHWTERSAKDLADNDVDRRKRELVVLINGAPRNRIPRPSGGHFRFETRMGETADNPDILVWTAMGDYAYSDELPKCLDVTDNVREKLQKVFLDPRLRDYRAWHFRNTDRTAELPPDKFIAEVVEASKKQVQVVCTDHRDTVDQLQDLQCESIVCRSLVPRFTCGGGPHHRNDKVLESQGMTKDQLNMSVLEDLFLLAGASETTYLCRASTYKKFVERGLRQNWFKKVLDNSISP